MSRAAAAGVPVERIILDPGLGFAKRAEHTFAALAGLDRFAALDRPILSGPSRKSFLTAAMPARSPLERDWGTRGRGDRERPGRRAHRPRARCQGDGRRRARGRPNPARGLTRGAFGGRPGVSPDRHRRPTPVFRPRRSSVNSVRTELAYKSGKREAASAGRATSAAAVRRPVWLACGRFGRSSDPLPTRSVPELQILERGSAVVRDFSVARRNSVRTE